MKKIKISKHILLSGISNFTVTNYTGTWHEYSRLFLIPEAYGKLIQIFFEIYPELNLFREMCSRHLQ